MTDCEYIKLCEKAFGATVPGCKDDHWRGCPNHDLIVLVHNKAIEAVISMIEKIGTLYLDSVEDIKTLKKPASQEGV